MIETAAHRVEVAAPTEAAVDLAIAACDGEPRSERSSFWSPTSGRN
jgi:hypothetical protein